MDMIRKAFVFLLVFFISAGVSLSAGRDKTSEPTYQLPPLRVQNAFLVDPSDKPVLLHGVNLGSWLLVEPWMLSLRKAECAVPDQYTLEDILSSRFGEAEKDSMMEMYRESWITERDFRIIRSFGFNMVRLPIHYSILEDDAHPMTLRPDAWKWIDQAISWADANGLYVVLDLHGAQGGQSFEDHTGHVGVNAFWENSDYQRRFIWLWQQIAERYRDCPVVAAYDILNEPYGAAPEDHLALFEKVYPEIRAVDPSKLIFPPSDRTDFSHYGKPADHGWTNVGFTLHFYPGVHDSQPPELSTHLQFLNKLAEYEKLVRDLQVPFMVGEMNVVFKGAGGAAMMRRYMDVYASYGWHSAIWSYKAVSANGGVGDVCWGLVTNKKPPQLPCFQTASKMEIAVYMRHFKTEEYEIYDDLRDWLTRKNVKFPPEILQ